MAVVLIVEDDIALRGLTELALNELGYQTLSAGDVDEALAVLRSPDHIDALFTDIYLKENVIGGCEVARQAVQIRPTLRVLYTTGHQLHGPVRARFVQGAGCLGKPYTAEQLEAALKNLLAPSGPRRDAGEE